MLFPKVSVISCTTLQYVVMCCVTLFLQARLVLSLTTKLVLYTLFSQASSSLPNTAYVKLIDIWFFFCICTLFFIILVHVVVEHLPRDMAGQGQGQGLGGGHQRIVKGEGNGGEATMTKKIVEGQTEAWQDRKEVGTPAEEEGKGGQAVDWPARGKYWLDAKLQEYRGNVRSGHAVSREPFRYPRQHEVWPSEIRDTCPGQVTRRLRKVKPHPTHIEATEGGMEKGACGGGRWRYWVRACVVVGVVRFVVVPFATVVFLAFYWSAIMPSQ